MHNLLTVSERLFTSRRLNYNRKNDCVEHKVGHYQYYNRDLGS